MTGTQTVIMWKSLFIKRNMFRKLLANPVVHFLIMFCHLKENNTIRDFPTLFLSQTVLESTSECYNICSKFWYEIRNQPSSQSMCLPHFTIQMAVKILDQTTTTNSTSLTQPPLLLTKIGEIFWFSLILFHWKESPGKLWKLRIHLLLR